MIDSFTIRGGLNRENDLKFALSEDEYEQVKDAPDEWLKIIYPLVYKYGGSVYHVLNILDKLNDENDDEALAFIERAKAHKPARLHLLNEAGADAARTKGLANYNFIFSDYVNDRSAVTNFFRDIGFIREIECALNALHGRHLITPRSSYTIEGYNAMTKFFRECWGQIHPDDDPVLGMISYPSYHAVVASNMVKL